MKSSRNIPSKKRETPTFKYNSPNAKHYASPNARILHTRAEIQLSQLPMDPVVKVTEQDLQRHGKEIAYEAYTDDLEYGITFTKLDSYLVDLRDDEKHMKFRIGCSFFSWFTCAVGIFVILFSTASTKAFSSQPKVLWLFCVGCALEVPCLLWFLAFFCVSREEWRRRQNIRRKRKQRITDFGSNFTNDTKLHEEVIATRVVRDVCEKTAKYEEALAQRNVVSSNPMGYPSVGRTRKVHNIVPVKSKFESLETMPPLNSSPS